MHQENRRSFVKKSLATSISISFAGLIRAHGEEGGGSTTWSPDQTTVPPTTDSGGTTSSFFSTWNPEESTIEMTTFGDTTTWNPDATTVTNISSTIPISYILTCVSEPLDGDWGGNISAMDSWNNPSNYDLSTLLLFGQRAWSSAFAITNYIHPTWAKQCIRKGNPGRYNGTQSTICAAAAYALVGTSAAGYSTKMAIPKMRMTISCNPTTGDITHQTSGSGIEENTWDGSPFKATSKITFNRVDDNPKHVKVKISWEFAWHGFDSASINIGLTPWKRLVRFGASLNNGVLALGKSAEFEFKALTKTEYSNQFSDLTDDQARDIVVDGRIIRAPRGTFSGGTTNHQECVSTFTKIVSLAHRGTSSAPWEF